MRSALEEGHVGRESDGSRYWVAALGTRGGAFEAQIDEFDVNEVVAECARLLQMSKQARAWGGA